MLVLAYLVAAFSVILWRSLAPEESASSALGIVVFVLVLLFSGVGVVANLLVLVAIRVNRRTLMLPWLVFQLMVVLGKKKNGQHLLSRFNRTTLPNGFSLLGTIANSINVFYACF